MINFVPSLADTELTCTSNCTIGTPLARSGSPIYEEVTSSIVNLFSYVLAFHLTRAVRHNATERWQRAILERYGPVMMEKYCFPSYDEVQYFKDIGNFTNQDGDNSPKLKITKKDLEYSFTWTLKTIVEVFYQQEITQARPCLHFLFSEEGKDWHNRTFEFAAMHTYDLGRLWTNNTLEKDVEECCLRFLDHFSRAPEDAMETQYAEYSIKSFVGDVGTVLRKSVEEYVEQQLDIANLQLFFEEIVNPLVLFRAAFEAIIMEKSKTLDKLLLESLDNSSLHIEMIEDRNDVYGQMVLEGAKFYSKGHSKALKMIGLKREEAARRLLPPSKSASRRARKRLEAQLLLASKEDIILFIAEARLTASSLAATAAMTSLPSTTTDLETTLLLAAEFAESVEDFRQAKLLFALMSKIAAMMQSVDLSDTTIEPKSSTQDSARLIEIDGFDYRDLPGLDDASDTDSEGE